MALTEPSDVTTVAYLTATLWNTLKSLLFDALGSQEFTESNYVTNDESVTDSLDALDMGIKDVRDEVVANMIPATKKMLWYEDTAPAGHTIVTTVDDKSAFVTKGSAAGGSPGGAAHMASFAFDGGSNADALVITDTIQLVGGAGWTCVLRAIEYTGSAPTQTGRIYYDTLAVGVPADEDAIEDNNSRSFTADVNGANRVAGSWTITGITGANHNHQWYKDMVTDAHDQSYDSDGNVDNLDTVETKDGAFRGIDITGGGSSVINLDLYTTKVQPSVSADGEWRPAAACMIITAKDAYSI